MLPISEFFICRAEWVDEGLKAEPEATTAWHVVEVVAPHDLRLKAEV